MGTDDADLENTEWGKGTKLPSGLDLGVVRTPGAPGYWHLERWGYERPGAAL